MAVIEIPSAVSSRSDPFSRWRRMLHAFRIWRRKRRSRRRLAELDDRMLRDIGVTRAEAFREAGKSVSVLEPSMWNGYWQLPGGSWR